MHLVHVLIPLADLMDDLPRELGNLGMILPAVKEIKSLLTNDAALPMIVAAFAETQTNNIPSHYDRYYTDKSILLASVLDPRFKTEWIICDVCVQRTWEICIFLVVETGD